MMQDEIMRMAREAGMDIDDEASGFGAIITAEPSDLERFADLVAAHEREKLAEQEQVAWEHLGIPSVNGKQTEHEPVKMMNSVGNTEAYMPDQQTAGFNIPLYAAPQPVQQEPVGRWNWNEAKFEWLTKFDYHKHHMTPLYAAPVRTKDLTDDEIGEIYGKFQDNLLIQLGDFARTVIAADREKNNGTDYG